MSGLPPTIHNTDIGTPSNEWASKTTTTAFARSADAHGPDYHDDASSGFADSGTTGGVSVSSADHANKGPFDPKLTSVGSDVPGAYPPTPGDSDLTRQTSVKESAQHAAESGYAFVTSAATTAATTAASYLPKGVVDTVSSYMPTSHATSTMDSARASEHDTEHKTSLPSTESGGAGSREHVGGIGSLPGPMNEQGVAKLPHENNTNEQYITAGGAAAAVAGGAYALKDSVVGSVPSSQQAKQSTQSTVEAAKQYVPDVGTGTQKPTTAVTASTLPTHEPFGAQPGNHSLGAGALPGNQSEPHVARLPEESAHPQYDSGPMDTGAQVALKPSEEGHGNEANSGEMKYVAGVGALVGAGSAEGVARLPAEREREGVREASKEDQKPKPEQEQSRKKEPQPETVQGQDQKGMEREQTGEQTKSTNKTKDDTKEKGAGTGASGPGLPNKGSGYQTDYHPADLHPSSNKASDPATQASEGEKSLGATQSDANRPPEEQRPPNQQAPAETHKERKATFMEKMKGEAKVLLGKIEGKHDKVEEGQRLRHPKTEA